MTWKQTITQNRLFGSVGAALTVVVGLAVAFGPWQGLTHLSYDLPFAFRSAVPVNEAVIVYMDDKSRSELGQPTDGIWDRSLHTQLLKQLKAASVKAVVFDVFFAEPGNARVDGELAEAMALHGKVVVGSVLASSDGPGGSFSSFRMVLPTEPIRSVARAGLSMSEIDADDVIRTHSHSPEHGQSLVEAAADAVAAVPVHADEQRWLNYYGPSGTIPHFSYSDALSANIPAEVFSRKVVFVGAGPLGISHAGVRAYDFSTPYTRWTGDRSPGVEIQTTAFLNLIRRDWLVRLSPGSEACLIIAIGLVFGFGLTLLRPWPATGVALAGTVAVAAGAFWLLWQTHIWFAWLPICFVQIPCAWGLAVLVHRRRSAEQAGCPIRAHTGLRDSVGDEAEQLIRRAAEQAKGLGLSTSQLESPQLKEAVIVRFPQGTSKPGVEVLLDRDSGKLIQMSVASAKAKPEEP